MMASVGVRETSLIAWMRVQPLGDKQERVYDVIRSNGRVTNMEIAQLLGWSINRVTPRVMELRKMDRVRLDGYRECSVTGRTACVWTVC